MNKHYPYLFRNMIQGCKSIISRYHLFINKELVFILDEHTDSGLDWSSVCTLFYNVWSMLVPNFLIWSNFVYNWVSFMVPCRIKNL